MITLGPKTIKMLLIVHLVFMACWIGGAISWLPLIFKMDTGNYEATLTTYRNMKSIAFGVIGWGGIGSFLTGLLLGIFSPWKLFVHKWVTVKFVLVIGLIASGMKLIEPLMLENLRLLETGRDALNDPLFLHNHSTIVWRILVEEAGFISIITIALFKPWRKFKSNER